MVLAQILLRHPNLQKNSQVENIAIEAVMLYLKFKHPNAVISRGKDGADLEVNQSGIIEGCEVKGTTDPDIAWAKLKVSSQACYDALTNGLILIRVASIGSSRMTLHFMKCNEDFILVPRSSVEGLYKTIKRNQLKTLTNALNTTTV